MGGVSVESVSVESFVQWVLNHLWAASSDAHGWAKGWMTAFQNHFTAPSVSLTRVRLCEMT